MWNECDDSDDLNHNGDNSGEDAAIAADVGMSFVVVAATVTNTASMTIIVDHQDQPGSCMTKIPVDNNTNSYFSYNSQTNIFTLAYILIT